MQRALGRLTGWTIALLPLAIAILLATMAPDVAPLGASVRESYPWVPTLDINLSLRLDGLSLLMSMLISGIGAVIFIYAGGYLKGHPHLGRLYAYLLMFMGSMLGVVLADNLLALFVFWELTSISSYLLIGFDHTRPKARKSALQALLVTGLGGLAILAGAVMLGSVAGTLEISELYAQRDLIHASPLYTPIVLLFILGAFTKSAQFPFHFWLPAAMEAPTPVSAYLHSSTMVKAGVYLLARLAPILGGAALWHDLLTWFGAATMLVGAWLAFRQTVMKPLLAYSTVSALGTIVMALGVGTAAAVEAGMVFLLAHAFYKGALFMCAGAIDHETGEKNLVNLSGLGRRMPILFAATALAAISFAGIPPLVGFIGKELALKALLPAPDMGQEGPALAILFTLAAALSVAVAIRIGFRPFVGNLKPTPLAPHDPPPALLAGPVALAGLGLAAALLPNILAYPLVQPAAAAILQAEAHPHIALWHGLNLALLLSAVATVVGAGLFAAQRTLLRAAAPLDALDAVGPSRFYDWTLGAVLGLALFQTRALQTGYLRQYLFVTIGATVAVVGATLTLKGGLVDLPPVGDVRFYEAGLIALILIGAAFAATARNRLAAIAALGLVGYGIAFIFVLFGAPDLALTQFCVETLTVVLLVLAFYILPDFRGLSGGPQKVRDLLIALTGGAMMAGLVLLTTRAESDHAVSNYYAAHSLPDAYGRNVVNVILVDFRAIDTLGEITVLVVAAIGVYALMKLSMWKSERPPAEPDPAPALTPAPPEAPERGADA